METVKKSNNFRPVLLFYTGWGNTDFAKQLSAYFQKGEAHIFQGSKEAVEYAGDQENNSPDAVVMEISVHGSATEKDRSRVEKRVGIDLRDVFGKKADTQELACAIEILKACKRHPESSPFKPKVFLRSSSENAELIAQTLAYHTGYDVYLLNKQVFLERDKFFEPVLLDDFSALIEQSTRITAPETLPQVEHETEADPAVAVA